MSNFSASGSDVEGAVLVAGNLTASNYAINQNNKDAYGASGYALVVGGNLNYSSGSIKNGEYYVGGTSTTSSVGFNGASKVATSPTAFAATSKQLKDTSVSLSKVAATGSSAVQYGGMTLTGSSTGKVQVFDLTSAALGSVNNFKFSNLNANDTLILNISGSNVNLSGGYDNFSGYNVLYNFYEAKTITLNGVGLYGSILAPLASLNGGGGQINGNVVVGNWNSNIQVNSNHYFNASNVAGFVSAVPEPATYAMLLAGLGLLVCMARRRRNNAES